MEMEASNDMPDIANFYVLSTMEGYSGTCGGRFSGVEEHNSMTEALESQLEWIEDYGYDELADNIRTRLENTITHLKDGIKIIPEYLSYSYGSTQYITHVAGYWDTFALESLSFFKKDIEKELNLLEDSNVPLEESEELHHQLGIINELINRTDIHSPDFAKKFFEVKQNYGNRHC
jgi:hypothetical protein